MADEPGAMGGLGAAAKEFESTLKRMRSTIDGIVGASGKISANFRQAGQAAGSAKTGGSPDAHAGEAGGVGAGRKTGMANSLGKITSKLSGSQGGGEGGEGGGAKGGGGGGGGAISNLAAAASGSGGGMGGYVKAAAVGTGVAVAAGATKSVVAAGYNVGRTSTGAAGEIMQARYVANMSGVNLDDFRAKSQISSYSPTDILKGNVSYINAGMVARKGEAAGARDLAAQAASANIMGNTVAQQVAVNQEAYRPETYNALMVAGISTVDQKGTPLDALQISNQMAARFTGGKALTKEQVSAELGPMGMVNQQLKAMGLSEEYIQANRPGLQAALTTGGKATQEDLQRERDKLPPGSQALLKKSQSELDKSAKTAADVDQGFADATEHLADFNKWLGDLMDGPAGPFLKWVERVGATKETGEAGGMPGWLATGLAFLPKPFAEGDTNVPSDSVVKVHQGEMILPARIATAVRGELGLGSDNKFNASHETKFVSSVMAQDQSRSMDLSSPSSNGGSSNPTPPVVNITVNVQQASEAEARRLADMVQKYLKSGTELSGVGLGQVFR